MTGKQLGSLPGLQKGPSREMTMMCNFTVKSLFIAETVDEGVHHALDLNLDWNELQATASETPSVLRGSVREMLC